MSPTEDELRSALRAGAGIPLDTDAVISRARAQGAAIHARRVRLASSAAVVAVVAGLGVGGGFVLARHTQSHSSNTSSGGSVVAGAGAAGSGAASSGTHATDKANPAFGAAPCPSTLPQSSANAPNPDVTFFTKPVATILVCAFATDDALVTTGAGDPITATITGSQAAALARSIETAPRTLQARPCPLYRTNQPTLLMRPRATDGTALPDVTTTVLQNPCNSTITNGIALRYNWTPSLLSSYLDELAKAGPTPAPPLPTHS